MLRHEPLRRGLFRRGLFRHAPLAVMLLLACTAALEPPAREPGHPLQTDRLEYRVRRANDGLATEIPFSYTNETGRTVYVVNCNRIVPPVLEKSVKGEWVTAWGAAVPECLSPPIVIEPGAEYVDTLRVFAGLPANNVYPKFRVAEVEGIYRLVWTRVVYDYDTTRPDFGEPLSLEDRVSNEFLLRK